ncbi:hypothetical protein Q1695_006566 [Nippostrongylus brasiliensis]|nr:hypothetical protein Q1695_006566 [Nippostrongylus brasiliensis]
MFCMRARCNRQRAAQLPSSTVCPETARHSSLFATQHQLPSNPPPYQATHNQPLSCPVAFYPDNIYGRGLETSFINRMETRLNDILDGPNYYSGRRDPSVPLPPGVVVVQVLQPSAPPLSPTFVASRHSLYPQLSTSDQEYANRQIALQK